MRPKKIKTVTCVPGQKCFKPQCKEDDTLEAVELEFDEYEVIRLSDYMGMQQYEVARKMEIHRSTVSRMLRHARQKVADALTNNKAIQIKACC